jgi:hypothetical protein
MNTNKSTAKGKRGVDFPFEFRIASKIATPLLISAKHLHPLISAKSASYTLA